MEYKRALEAARLLKPTQEAGHLRMAHEASDKVEYPRREDLLLTVRRENANMVAKVAKAQQVAKTIMVGEGAHALAASNAKKLAAKAERTSRALVASLGEYYPPPRPPTSSNS